MTASTNRSEQKVLSFGPLLLSIISIFLILEFIGEIYPDWIANSLCFRVIGCNAGFFGYDALLHCVSGIAETLTLFWMAERYSRFNVFHSSSIVRSAIMILGIVALLSITWEFIEFSYDSVRMAVFHMNLLSPNTLSQPTNADTIGDIALGLLGSALTLLLMMRFDPSLLRNGHGK